MKRTLCTVLAGLFISVSVWACEAPSTPNPTPTAVVVKDTVKKTYRLAKYTQSCCSNIVEYSLKQNVQGFFKASSNTNKQQITVWFDPAQSSSDDVEKALNETPYKVVKVLR